jgi:DMSO/TMAO reductase YedYZ molybdopterin-dependent catalytic subunit
MGVFTGFSGRRRSDNPGLPPGQYETTTFPVLSAGPTPRIPQDQWEFTIATETGELHRWTWDEFRALPAEEVTTDIHCVTSWSKFGTAWRGVAIDTLLAGITTDATHTMAHSYGGYTTNVPLADLTGGKAWIAFDFDGAPLDPEHGGPARLLVPHLYFWKSAKWVRGLTLMTHDAPGFWEQNGYNMYGDPWLEQRYSD